MAEDAAQAFFDYGRLSELYGRAPDHFGRDARLADLHERMLFELESSLASIPERYFISLEIFDTFFMDEKLEPYLEGLKSLHDRILDEERTVKNVLTYLHEKYAFKTSTMPEADTTGLQKKPSGMTKSSIFPWKKMF